MDSNERNIASIAKSCPAHIPQLSVCNKKIIEMSQKMCNKNVTENCDNKKIKKK